MLLITCPRAIPPFLRTEVEALGFEVAAEHAAGIEVHGTFEDCYKLNLWLRTAHRVLYRLDHWDCRSTYELYEGVRNIPWEDWIDADGYVSVISSIDTPSIDNTQFANVKCKDAIVDRIRLKKGRRPDSGPLNDRAVVFLYWHNNTCMVYIDTSGKPLSERGYRIHPGKAPLRESLAAAIVLATAWKPGRAFHNPMCGSATLGIEAALIQRNIAPGLQRENFGFMHVLPFKKTEWLKELDEAKSAQQKSESGQNNIVCSDNDKRIIPLARENAERAGVVNDISFGCVDFRKHPITLATETANASDVVVLNPEYGIRLGQEDELRPVYSAIGDWFKQECSGYIGYVFTGNLNLAKEIGLKAKHRTPFWNADVECRLFSYELYGGTRRVYAGKTQTE